MSRPQIKITLIDRKGPHGCHRGHKIGDSYDLILSEGSSVPWPCMWHFHMWIFLDMVEPSREMSRELQCSVVLMWTRSMCSG